MIAVLFSLRNSVDIMDSSGRYEMNMVEDWLANAYDGMSRRQFLARMSSAGIGLTGFAIASSSIAGEVITTPSAGLIVTEGKVLSGDFPVPIYEAHPPG